MQMKIGVIHKIRGNSSRAAIMYFHLLCSFLGGQHAFMFPTLMLLFCKVHDNLQVSGIRNAVFYLQFSPSPTK